MTILTSIILIIVIYLSFFLIWRLFFLRNPKRVPPTSNCIVSPADGYIVYIKRVEKGQLIISEKQGRKVSWSHVIGMDSINESGYLIGIAMTPFSVHRNRIPYEGTIEQIYHKSSSYNKSMVVLMGKLLLKLPFSDIFPKTTLENEKLTLKIATKLGNYYITQIAGDQINRIIIWVGINQNVKTGMQYGMIRFGSQCDIFLPDTLCATTEINIGDYVYAGTTIITKLNF